VIVSFYGATESGYFLDLIAFHDALSFSHHGSFVDDVLLLDFECKNFIAGNK
jgi:hypothetical protein